MRQALFALFVSAAVITSVMAEESVYFADDTLKSLVEDELWLSNPTATDMLELTSLYGGDVGITSLTGLEYAVNMQSLSLPCNQFSDISALSSMSNLQKLVINNNSVGDLSALSGMVHLYHLDAHDNHYISDLSPLSGLSSLSTLILRGNRVSDLSPLSGLTGLRELVVERNEISDLSGLLGLTNLSYLDLAQNPLSDEAFDVQIPQIEANNPRVLIVHSGGPFTVATSSSAGGSVIDPGEGEFVYTRVDFVCLEAQADPGFVFAGWVGTYSTEENPVFITLDRDYQVRAMFSSLRSELYVDDDAPEDPKPGNSLVGDPQEDGTPAHPFDAIQDAVDVAMDGATIIVRPGTYRERIDLLGKEIHLAAIDPADPNGGPCAIIEGTGTGPVVRIGSGGGSNCSLTGFVITKGRGNSAGAIDCSYSSPTLKNCLIVGNRCTDSNGGALYFYNSKAVLINCTIVDNYGGEDGAALMLVDSDITMTDSIVWGNRPYEISPTGTSTPMIQYCCVRGWWADTGNTHSDPLFARRGHWASPTDPTLVLIWDNSQAVWVGGDYHLQSQAGRWESLSGLWVSDNATSPAIDAGDPISEVGDEPSPNGGRINMGAYGGTTEASKSFVAVSP